MIRARTLALAGVALISATLLAGCAPAVYPTAGQTNIPATTTPSTASAAPSSQPAPPPPPPSPSPPPCDATKLEVSYIASNNNAAGKFYGTLDFRNTSAAACQGYGFPQVWFYDGSKNVGDPAAETSDPTPQFITLQPDQWMTSQVVITDADLIDGCTIVSVTSLDVHPPGADDSVAVPIPATDACSNGASLMSVTAVVFK
jgi:hypothetical protein